jgi:hypothetical protein
MTKNTSDSSLHLYRADCILVFAAILDLIGVTRELPEMKKKKIFDFLLN